ncbi:MAG TPA: hypothetical protein VFP22_00380 [Candidatus Limnocylindrales bacterium]|nr:hypothetical protein [Candidatus Limnocylindrales bacterium]
MSVRSNPSALAVGWDPEPDEESGEGEPRDAADGGAANEDVLTVVS